MFKIGDKVKVLPGGSFSHALKVGSTGTIVSLPWTPEEGITRVDVEGWLDSYVNTQIVQTVATNELQLMSIDILTDEEIQDIDDQTHFHESRDWSIRFARNVLKAAEDKKKMGNNNVLG